MVERAKAVSVSGLAVEVLGRFMLGAALVLVLFLGAAKSLAGDDGRLGPGALMLVTGGAALLLLGVWWVALWFALRRGRAAGLQHADDRHTLLLERGLDLILAACVALTALRLVAMRVAVVHVCFASVGLFVALTRLALARGLRVPSGRWPTTRVVALAAVLALAATW